MIPFQTVSGFDDGFFWEFAGYSIDSSPAGSGTTNVFEIYDSNLDGNENSSDHLSVKVESKNFSGASIETLNIVLNELGDGSMNLTIPNNLFAHAFLRAS